MTFIICDSVLSFFQNVGIAILTISVIGCLRWAFYTNEKLNFLRK